MIISEDEVEEIKWEGTSSGNIHTNKKIVSQGVEIYQSTRSDEEMYKKEAHKFLFRSGCQ